MHYWINQFAAAPDIPGGTRHFEFARRLGQLGVPVEVVAADVNLATRRYTRRASARDRRRIYEHIDGVPFSWLHTLTYESNDWRRSIGMLRFAQSAFSYLLTAPVEPATVFLGSTPTLFAALAAERAARLRGVRFVLEVRDLWPESLIEMTGREGATARVLRRLADYLYRRADRIIVFTERNRDAIRARGVADDRFVYVPNSVDIERFGVDEPASLNVPDDAIVAVYAGAHGPANDLDTALDAAEILRGRSRVHLLLVGDGTEKQRLRTSAAERGLDNVTFLDPVPKQQIPPLFAACHIGLLTLKDLPLFRYGVSPNKLFDYLAAGLPVVTNVGGDCAQIVTDAGAGFVAEPGSAEALAAALEGAAGVEPGERRRLGAAGRAYVGQHYSRDKLVHRLAEILEPGWEPRRRAVSSAV